MTADSSQAAAGNRPRLAESQLEAVHSIVDVAIEPLALDELLEELLRRLRSVLSADNVTILLTEGDRLRVRATSGLQAELDGLVEVPIGRGLSGRVAAERRPWVIDDLSQEPEVWSPVLRERLHSMVAVPLLYGKSVIGVLHAGTVAPRDFRPDVMLLELVAERAASAIERARMEEERSEQLRLLRESEQRVRTLFDSAQVGFVARDREGRVVEANEAYARMIGFPSPAALVGTGLDAITSADGLADLRARFEAMITGPDERLEVENDYLSREGSVVHGRISSTIIRDSGGQPELMLSIIEDVTDRRKLEEQLHESQKMDALGRFAGAIAHDFNNVLTAILGFNQLMGVELDADHPLQREIREIGAAAERAATLTRQLLTFSRRQVVTRQPLSATEIVARLAPMLERLLPEDIELVLNLTPCPAVVEADRSQLETVLANLVVNARDAMPAGGRLAIEVSTPEIDPDFARRRLSLEPGRYVVIAVSDTGHGIDPETQKLIFEPFFTTKPPGMGTGLGLATVFGIVRQSGGTISVYSEPGHGSTFRIYLPRVDRPTDGSDRTEPAHAPARPQGAGTVLVVDDEAGVRGVVERQLTRLGYAVLAAHDGEQALALADQHEGPIDLLISDIVLPGLSGPDVAEQIAARRGTIKVLFTSGYPGDEVSRRGLGGDAAFLEKPFTLDSLAEVVARLVHSRSEP